MERTIVKGRPKASLYYLTILGGVQAVDLSSQSVDLDTLNDPGKWHISGATATNSPTTGVFLLIVEVGLAKRRAQTAIVISTGETFRRVRTNTQAWQSWHQIYDTSLLTNSTLLSPLASALGVNQGVDINEETDLNNIKLYGFNLCMFTGTTMPENAPIEMTSPRFLLLVMRPAITGSHIIQIFNARSSNTLYFRTYMGTWTQWKEL